MLGILGYCLGWHGEESAIVYDTPDGTPLLEWVRQGPTHPSWFPISFQFVEQHGSKNKLHWDLGVRVDHPGRTRFYPHLRINDTIKRTDYKIVDIIHRSAEQAGDGAGTARSSITIENETERVELFLGQPRRDTGGGLIHCFVFFPRTPVRGLSSGHWVKSGGILHLRHRNREERYKVIGESASDVRLQRIEEGDAVGEPLPVQPYDQQEHIEWRRKYSPGHP